MSLSDREVDVLIAKHLFGLEVPGTAPCRADEEGLYVTSYGEGEEHPVYLAHCTCDVAEADDITMYGHIWACFEVVPQYTIDPLPVKEKLRELGYEMCIVWNMPSTVSVDVIHTKSKACGFSEALTEGRALCEAALVAVGREDNEAYY